MNAEQGSSRGGGAGGQSGSDQQGVKRKHEDSDEDDEPPDEVRLWESGFKASFRCFFVAFLHLKSRTII